MQEPKKSNVVVTGRSISGQGGRSSRSLKKVFALDCEMCHVVDTKAKGKDAGVISKFPIQVTLLDEGYEVVYNQLIRPNKNLTVVDDRAVIHGIPESQFRREGISWQVARDRVQNLIAGQVVTGHDLKYDLGALKIEHSDVRDTARSQYFMVFRPERRIYQPRSLADLAELHLGVNMRASGKHDSAEDAKISMELYHKFKNVVW